ncbi:non-canonical purine NTP pyrophosphatase [Candidatus Woesearchaeota archaeon]|nr:non-canonical purine NTP pyrophosphatase [Candidatus Woesearchaeota archaeon]
MDLYFVTGNKHKVEEVEIALKGSGIKVHLLDAEKIEPEDWKLEDVAKNNAKRIADETGKTVIVEDTGIFFEAFDNFPGNRPKRWFETLGYEGLLGKFKVGTPEEITNRKAHFKTIIGYCEPGKDPILFTGELHGKIAKEAKGTDANVMPYERIFVCERKNSDGKNEIKTLYEYSREEKGKFSHRGKAFKKLREFLMKNK